MRIIGGFLKGQSISHFKSLITRPLKDSVRENIFNILAHSHLIDVDINKSAVLDLYSGTGSFGIECTSRGAKKIYYVEKNKDVANILKKNLLNLSIEKNALLTIDEISNFLKLKLKKKFNIIFFDPPFAQKKISEELKLIKTNKIFKDNHVVIIHREKGSEENFRNILNILIVREYGRSKIIFGKFLT